MIKINKKILDVHYFPSGELAINGIIPAKHNNMFCIEWHWESNEELLHLIFIVEHIKSNVTNNHNVFKLIMPFCPYARMDRVKEDWDVFTLKYFANLINGLGFSEVHILDPHSDVCMGLINNCVDISKSLRNRVIHELFKTLHVDYVCFPDTGCEKRLNDIGLPSLVGMKSRDWNTGEITSLDIIGTEKITKESFDVLIVDDICSKGGTFYHTAKALKKAGANKVYLYVTHVEESVGDGEFQPCPKNNDDGVTLVPLLDTGYIDKMYGLIKFGYRPSGYVVYNHPLLEII